jgi:hypothetical protein
MSREASPVRTLAKLPEIPAGGRNFPLNFVNRCFGLDNELFLSPTIRRAIFENQPIHTYEERSSDGSSGVDVYYYRLQCGQCVPVNKEFCYRSYQGDSRCLIDTFRGDPFNPCCVYELYNIFKNGDTTTRWFRKKLSCTKGNFDYHFLYFRFYHYP